MARKGWEALSAAYRKRLEKSGISRADYEGGASIKKARGHGITPERPIGYNPQQYPQYSQRRSSLERQVQARKEQVFGNSARWEAGRSMRAIREKPPSMALLRWALQASDEEIYDAVREDPETYRFLTYH